MYGKNLKQLSDLKQSFKFNDWVGGFYFIE